MLNHSTLHTVSGARTGAGAGAGDGAGVKTGAKKLGQIKLSKI